MFSTPKGFKNVSDLKHFFQLKILPISNKNFCPCLKLANGNYKIKS